MPSLKENTKLKLALAIVTGAPKAVANDIIETKPIATHKTSEVQSTQLNAAISLLSFLLILSLPRISLIKNLYFVNFIKPKLYTF